MILILDKQEGLKRNSTEAVKRGCTSPTIYWWSWTELKDNKIALNVGDGDGLTKDELAQCVDELPNETPS